MLENSRGEEQEGKAWKKQKRNNSGPGSNRTPLFAKSGSGEKKWKKNRAEDARKHEGRTNTPTKKGKTEKSLALRFLLRNQRACNKKKEPREGKKRDPGKRR